MTFATPRLIHGSNASPRGTPQHTRHSPSRSPARHSKNEQNLFLRRIIGTTATSNNGFDCLQSGDRFAFIAGSGAVVATLGEDCEVTQRFFCPKSVPSSGTPSSLYDSPTPIGAHQAARGRTLRESGVGLQAFGSPCNDGFDSPCSKAAATKTKTATCVSLSPDRRLVAIGETGHKPRVHIFSTLKEAPSDAPLMTLSEHTFGVRCLAFSPDSQYLATLGDVNDGFLYVWSIYQRVGSATLYASNKCTSNIRNMAWMGNSLITVGTRHVKVWRLDETPTSAKASPSKRFSDASFALASPSQKTLGGRNCLLGSLLDKTFSAVEPLSPSRAVVVTDQGDVCMLCDNDLVPSFTKVTDVGFRINAVTVRNKNSVVVAGADGQMKVVDLPQFLEVSSSDCPRSAKDVKIETTSGDTADFLAVAGTENRLFSLDSKRVIRVFESELNEQDELILSQATHFPAHAGPVLGIQSYKAHEADRPSFLTWSADGSVLFWHAGGDCSGSVSIPLEQFKQGGGDLANELRIVRVFDSGKQLVTGDRFGVLRILDTTSNQSSASTKAHESEITDIALFEIGGAMLIVSSGRDRLLQLFRWKDGEWEHLQTLEEHNGAVNGVMFSSDGKRLVSWSSDRSIMIMSAVMSPSPEAEVAGFLTEKAIALKATPMSVDALRSDNDTLLVATNDRYVSTYDIKTGQIKSSFRSADSDSGDAVILSSLMHAQLTKRTAVIIGVSSTDKSLRIYDESGRLLERDYGPTERMTGLASVSGDDQSNRKAIVTVALDGTIFLWDLMSGPDAVTQLLASLNVSSTGSPTASPTASRPAPRKILSSSDLSKLRGVQEEPEKAETDAQATPVRSGLGRKPSKLSMVHTPRLEPPVKTTTKSTSPPQNYATATEAQKRRISTFVHASTPEPSPKQWSQTVRGAPRPSANHASRRSFSSSSSPVAEVNTLILATESVCRNLHTYRKKLAASSDALPVDNCRELERELGLTSKALAEKSARNEAAMVKLLDQYSERLVELLDTKIEASVARQLSRSESTEASAA